MRNLFLIIGIVLLGVACSDREKLSGNEFLIKGEVSGVADGVVVELYRWDGNVGKPLTYDTLHNGRFSFREEAANPERLQISLQGEDFPPLSLGVWVAPGIRVEIKGEGKLHPLWEVNSDMAFQQEENRYKTHSRTLLAERAHLYTECNRLRGKRYSSTSEEEVKLYKKNIDSLDRILNTLQMEISLADMDILEQTAVSPVWMDKMESVALSIKYIADGEQLRPRVEALYGKMTAEDRNTLWGYRITAILFPPEVKEVGDDFADADLIDTAGKTQHLASYTGKWLLLDFWSSGCGLCIDAIPEMKEVAETYAGKLTIISININTDLRWKEFLGKEVLPGVNLRDPKSHGGLMTHYGVDGTPNYILITPDGKVAGKYPGYFLGGLKLICAKYMGTTKP